MHIVTAKAEGIAEVNPTCHIVTKDAAGDDVAAGAEESLEVRLCHVLGEAGDIEVGTLNGLAAGPGVGDLGEEREETLINCFDPSTFLWLNKSG